MPLTISLDLDGTIIADETDDQVWTKNIPRVYADTHGTSFDQAQQYVFAEYYRAEHVDKARNTDIPYWAERLSLTDANPLNDVIARITTPYDDINKLETMCQTHDITVFTNSERDLMNAKLKRLPFNDFEHTISAPTDYDSNKRRVSAWRQYLKDLDISTTNLIHIGDRRLDDVLVPQRLGIESYRLDRDNTRYSDFTSLEAVNKFLQQR